MESKPKRNFRRIVCPGCGQIGETVWEMSGKKATFVEVSPGFYERMTRKPPYPIELVCHSCGATQPEDEIGKS